MPQVHVPSRNGEAPVKWAHGLQSRSRCIAYRSLEYNEFEICQLLKDVRDVNGLGPHEQLPGDLLFLLKAIDKMIVADFICARVVHISTGQTNRDRSVEATIMLTSAGLVQIRKY